MISLIFCAKMENILWDDRATYIRKTLNLFLLRIQLLSCQGIVVWNHYFVILLWLCCCIQIIFITCGRKWGNFLELSRIFGPFDKATCVPALDGWYELFSLLDLALLGRHFSIASNQSTKSNEFGLKFSLFFDAYQNCKKGNFDQKTFSFHRVMTVNSLVINYCMNLKSVALAL